MFEPVTRSGMLYNSRNFAPLDDITQRVFFLNPWGPSFDALLQSW